jgi:hypothetical protein
MPDDVTAITKITFTIEKELTHCEVWFDTTNSYLTGSYRKKSFPASVSIIEILETHIADYLLWE